MNKLIKILLIAFLILVAGLTTFVAMTDVQIPQEDVSTDIPASDFIKG